MESGHLLRDIKKIGEFLCNLTKLRKSMVSRKLIGNLSVKRNHVIPMKVQFSKAQENCQRLFPSFPIVVNTAKLQKSDNGKVFRNKNIWDLS
jgi:hypothetical protein